MTDSAINHASGVFTSGHLGELSRVVSFDLVDSELETAGAKERRVRRMPSRVVVYLLLAGVLFAEQDWRQVYSRLFYGAAGTGKEPLGLGTE